MPRFLCFWFCASVWKTDRNSSKKEKKGKLFLVTALKKKSNNEMSRYKLFLGHLSPDARTRDVERFFKDHGFSKSIVEVVVKTGYGFVVSAFIFILY